MTGPDVERLVALSAEGKRGSGYLLMPDLLLTAGHCVGSQDSAVTVRKYSRHEGGYELSDERRTFRVAVEGTAEIDFALLKSTTDEPFEMGHDGRCDESRLGRLVGEEPVPAQSLGFPRSGGGGGRREAMDERGGRSGIRPSAHGFEAPSEAAELPDPGRGLHRRSAARHFGAACRVRLCSAGITWWV